MIIDSGCITGGLQSGQPDLAQQGFARPGDVQNGGRGRGVMWVLFPRLPSAIPVSMSPPSDSTLHNLVDLSMRLRFRPLALPPSVHSRQVLPTLSLDAVLQARIMVACCRAKTMLCQIVRCTMEQWAIATARPPQPVRCINSGPRRSHWRCHLQGMPDPSQISTSPSLLQGTATHGPTTPMHGHSNPHHRCEEWIHSWTTPTNRRTPQLN